MRCLILCLTCFLVVSNVDTDVLRKRGVGPVGSVLRSVLPHSSSKSYSVSFVSLVFESSLSLLLSGHGPKPTGGFLHVVAAS